MRCDVFQLSARTDDGDGLVVEVKSDLPPGTLVSLHVKAVAT